MSFQTRLVSQFRRPHGLLGHIAGWIMASRGSNLARNRWTVDLLDIQPGQRVLELGPGPGVTLGLLLERVGDGVVVAVDHSDVMLAQCRRRHRRALASGALTLIRSEFPGLPAGQQFDRIIGVNSMQFDAMTPAVLGALVRALTPGGRLAITFQPRGASASEDAAASFGERARSLFQAAGLSAVRVQTLALEPVSAVCVVGERR